MGGQPVRADDMDPEEHSQRLHFELRPATASTPRVSPGSWVKVGVLGERFWCRVKSVRAGVTGVLVATVDNDLVSCPWKVGDEVTFQETNVLEVASLTDRGRFEHMVLVSDSYVDVARLWHHWRQSKGVSVAPRPDTQYIVGRELI